ncbi:TonB-dependent receptor [Fodinibius sp. Rm-B-1B1-1]|uniref:TonB-dependent receptor n=1 Tax=Fodinibius alkaliphilus TaxID=3140241 RepID=UPI00315A9015
MNRSILKKVALLGVIGFAFTWFTSNTAYGQTQISGTVIVADEGTTMGGVNVSVKGKVIGTSTGVDGTFTLNVQQSPPLTLVFSMVGFKTREIEITESSVTDLTVELTEAAIVGDEVVVSASRVEENILESPVSIEKIDAIGIQQAASPSFYESIANLKGVDFSTQSITFKSINTRGFNANGNTRFVQLIDGIDNQAPGLNFPVGNVVGIPELDLESAELIPGVASALYGPNALNGILLLNSKSPFEYQGLSAQVKMGANHFDSNVEDNPQLYQDYGLRYANAVNNKFAYKFNFSYLRAQDFVAQDTRDMGPASFGAVERGATSRNGNRVYNGVNVYGNQLLTIGQIADQQIAQGNQNVAAIRNLLPDGEAGAFTPTGFPESSFVDNTSESLKLGTALHYRVTDDYEVLGQFNWGAGSSVYTANDRFVLDDFNIWTAKLELKNPNFFVRAYTTQEDAGDTYAANTLATLINVESFVPAYFQTFANARTQGATVEEAHAQARVAGNNAQVQPGTQQFESLSNQLRSTPISEGGALFVEKTALWHAETKYNFADIIDPSTVELIVGGSVRRYDLNSEGTLFALRDNGEEFDIDEFGAYAQASKTVLDDQLDLQGSLRYDKNKYFDGQLSPRLSAVFTIAGNHNIRASYQRGFRMPNTQTQFIDLDVVQRRLIGSNPQLVDRYNFETNTVYYENSIAEARQALNEGASMGEARALLEPVTFDEFKTEKVDSYEIGYKTLIGNKLFLDAYYYYSAYKDFIAEIRFTQAVDINERGNEDARDGFDPVPSGFNSEEERRDAIITNNFPNNDGRLQSYGFDVNADGTVEAHGFAFETKYVLGNGFSLGGNVAFNKLISQEDLIDQGFRAEYNTPEWRYNIQLENRKLTDQVGFNVVYRWQDAFLWESSFGKGVIDSYGTLDAQVSYRIPQFNTSIKLSGSNILNSQHVTSFGNPRLGAIYMVSFTFDQFMN